MMTEPLADMDDATYDAMMDINLRGTFNMLREGAKHLRDHGRVINFSTTALHLKLPGYAVYNATKAAVEAMTGVYAKELRGRQITVNAVAPGPIATELFLSGKTDEQIAQFPKWHHSNGLVSPMTLPVWCPSWLVPIPAGSTGRPSVPMAGWLKSAFPGIPASLFVSA